MAAVACRFRNVAYKIRFPTPNTKHLRYSSEQKGSPGSRYVKPLVGIRQYVAQKCFAFVRGYEKILETKFPRAFKVYQVFSVGSRELYRDFIEYMRISQELRKGKAVRDLTRLELQKYFQVPKDVIKVTPTLFIAALPFANYVIFPLAYAFPKVFLSPHFWSLQQKVDFALDLQRQKLYHFRPVFRQMQSKLNVVTNVELKDKFSNILFKLGSGIHPSSQDILSVKPLFEEKPFSVSTLSSSHLYGLCRIHGLRTHLGKRSRLWSHAGFLREMDLAIIREGILTMNLDDLRWACFLRGLNPLGLAKDDLIAWLQQWVEITQNLDSKSLSLLLHCPIFLAYNSSTNWGLIH